MSLRRRLTAGAIVARSMLSLDRAHRIPLVVAASAPWGATLGGAVSAAATRYPDRVAVGDDERSVTYAALWDRARRMGGGLLARGVGTDSTVGLLARNHVGFVEALVAIGVTGADVVLLNTGFGGPQLGDVVEHEGIELIVHDDEFAEVVAEAVDGRTAPSGSAVGSLDEAGLARLGTAEPAPPNRHQGRSVILTSGTTGRPKGAARGSDVAAIEGAAALLERVPFQLGDTQVVPAPLFHGWGMTHLLFGIARCATTVLARRFDPEATVAAVADHDADLLVVVPVMLQRMLALPDDVIDRHPMTSLRIIASSGSALGAPLASAALDRFGPVLYNFYGSTEVAIATIATPDDLARHPSTAGAPAFGVRVEILDERGVPVAPGEVGRVFVGGAMQFGGYTDGSGKEIRDGLLSSGDLGSMRGGLLFVEGREDDMIVSGGENVFPGEVEDLLAAHPDVADVAVVGIPDDDFGQALAAFVVPRPGASLDADVVRAHVRDHLARHKVPRRVELVDELPRNSTGKILRRRLAEG